MTTTSISFLQQRALDRREETERRRDHRDDRQPDADHDALDRDPARPPGDRDGLGQPIEPVHRDDDVGRLRRGRRTTRAHRDPDVGGGESRRVVDAVPDHDGPAGHVDALGLDRLDLLDRCPLGEDAVDADRGPDRLSDRRVVAGDHDDPADAGLAEEAEGARRLRPDRVLHDEDAGEIVVDLDEDGHRPLELDPVDRRARPGRHRPTVADPLATADARRIDRRPVRGCRDRPPPRRRSAGPAPATVPARRGRWRGRGRAATAGRATRRGRAGRSDRRPGGTATRSSRGRPVVNVPVLSMSRTRARPSVSRAPPPLTMTPRRALREMPATIAIGAASSSGHGVATTRTARARTGSPDSIQAMPASPRLATRKTPAYRSAIRTNGDFSVWAVRTSRTIPA